MTDKMTESSNLTYCRTCLDTGSNLKPFSEDLHQLFLQFTSINLDCTQNKWICIKCAAIMKNFKDFRAVCLRVDDILNNAIALDLTLINMEKKNLNLHNNLSKTDILSIDVDPVEDERRCDVFTHKSNLLNYVVLESDCDDITPQEDDDRFTDDDAQCNAIDVVEEKIEINVCKRQLNQISRKKPARIKIDTNLVSETILTKEEQIIEHRKRSTNEKYINAAYKCETCIISFKSESSLTNHMEKHSEKRGSHVCDLCQQRFPNKRRLTVHEILHATRLLCYACGTRIRDRTRVLDHLAWHAGCTYVCNICNSVFMKRSTLQNHIRLKHSECKYKCKHCNKCFLAKERLKEHELRHSSPKQSCKICDKRFYTVANLSNHMISHSSVRKYYCVECDSHFKTALNLKNHLEKTARHIDPMFLTFTCDECNKKFRSKLLLSQHIDTAHLKKKRFSCEICAGQYATKQGLNFHRRKAHNGFKEPKSHKCAVCEKAFTSKSLLVNHLRVHTGEKPFECVDCQRKFSQASSLRTHNKLVHLKLKRNIKKKSKIETENTEVELNGKKLDKTHTNTNPLADGNASLQQTFNNQYL